MILVAALFAASPAPLPYPNASAVACAVNETVDSLSCRAAQAARDNRPAESASLLEQAAAGLAGVRRDQALAAAGNMWIAAGDGKKAAATLDKALAGGTLSGTQLGLAQLDRARAAEEAGDLKAARALVTKAAETVSADPFLWYFSAALAIREDNIPLARATINRALTMAPGSALVLFEAGHVSKAAGDDKEARNYWEKAVAADPAGSTGAAARDALSMLDVPLTVTNEVAKRPDGDGEGPADPQP
ncbi:tetratricopeptide repeat protein [Sphingomonas jaspsi]|uniref:tetratricopeptide repeat protein n=1 Tax=Sphingomonas jaspsi TaxID=392409 RepID=UPI0004B939C4|nr:hypothetical protein [Sphingomonas jaspsi]